MPRRRSAITELADALAAGQSLLDGGLATQLEAQGADLTTTLWSAQLLIDDPAAVIAAHRAFFVAGAGLRPPRPTRHRPSSRPAVLILPGRRSRNSTTTGFAGWRLGRAYGAALADGSEYHGDYTLSVAELRALARPRIAALAEAGADVLALETIPCLAEVEALLAEVAGTGVRCWLSLTCAGERTPAGEPAYAGFAMARDVEEVVAVGVNCLHPAEVGVLVRRAAVASGGKPVVAYPNSGETWDPVRRRWTGQDDSIRISFRTGWRPAPGWSAAVVGSPPTTSAHSRRICARYSLRGFVEGAQILRMELVVHRYPQLRRFLLASLDLDLMRCGGWICPPRTGPTGHRSVGDRPARSGGSAHPSSPWRVRASPGRNGGHLGSAPAAPRGHRASVLFRCRRQSHVRRVLRPADPQRAPRSSSPDPDRCGGGRRDRRVQVHGSPIAAEEIMLRHGFRTTDLARTVLDLACTLPLEQAVMAGDAALRQGLDQIELANRLTGFAGRCGVGRRASWCLFSTIGARARGSRGADGSFTSDFRLLSRSSRSATRRVV